MNYALNCLNNGHVTVPTITGGAGAGRICRFDMEVADLSATNPLFGNTITGSGTADSVRLMSSTQVQVRAGSQTAAVITIAAGSIPLSTRFVFEVFKTSAPAIEVHVNGSVIGSASVSTLVLNQAFNVNFLCAVGSTTNRFRGKIYEADIVGTQFLNTDEPTATTWGTGTLVGFPTDGTQWSAYSSTTPITFTGTIPNQTFTNGDAVSVDLSTYFSGTQTPFSFANTGTALTGTGLTVSSAGILNGTATTGSITGAIVTGADADLDTASSNAFNVTVSAAGSPPAGTFTVGTITTTQTTASVPYTYSAADFDSIEYRIDGGATVTASASPQSLTGLTAGTTYGIQFRAVNAFGSGAWSTSAPFTTASVPVGTITLLGLADNTGTLWSNLSGIDCIVMNEAATSVVVTKTGLTSDADGDVIFNDAAIAAGTWYTVVIVSGTNRGIIRIQAT